jgi:hemolysin D
MSLIVRSAAPKPPVEDRGALQRQKPLRRPALLNEPRAISTEFLPSALAIIETPPSPVRHEVKWVFFALFAAVAALAWFGHVEDFTTAAGKIQATGRTKVVEPNVVGKIIAIHARDGDKVKEGDVVIELDPTDAVADRTIVVDKLVNLRAQMARQRVELITGRGDPVDVNTKMSWNADIPAKARVREEGVLRANLSKLASALADLTAQRKAAETLRDKFTSNIIAQNALLAVTSEHVTMNESLANEGWNSRLKVLEITGKLRAQQIALSALQAGLANAQAAIPVIDSQIAKTRETFVTDVTQSVAAGDRQVDELMQQLAKADQTLANMTLKSPTAGIVQNGAVTTVGQVVKPGQQLLQVVPEGAPLEIVAYVDNTNIGFVKVGAKVEVELETFPYTTYGTVPGTITEIGKDALPSAAAKNTLQSAALDGEVSQSTAAQKTGNIVFPITVKLSRSKMSIDGRIVNLTSGMATSVDILTENRRAIDYLVSPIIELFTTAGHEH